MARTTSVTQAAARKVPPTGAAATSTAAAPGESGETTTTDVPAQKIPAQKIPAQKSPRTSAAGKTTTPARTKPAPTRPVKKAAVTDAAPSTTRPTTRAARSTGRAPALAVKADEDPWTPEELAEVREGLVADRLRLRRQLNMAENELHDLMRDAGDGAGNDQADVGSTSFERDQEISLANNARDMLTQDERALGRIDDGSYGLCESCGQPIGKMRVMAFPRATLCLSCKQREERR